MKLQEVTREGWHQENIKFYFF